MLDVENRRLIMDRLGGAVDDLVADLYSDTAGGVSVVQEAEITSRLCQRLEDRLDNSQAGEYVFRVIAQSLPDRGPNSMEKLFGADLFLSISLDGADGFDKGIFIQAKYDRNINRIELKDACRRMEAIAERQGVYVWVYEPDGVKVLSSHQVDQMKQNSLTGIQPRTMTGFTGRILDCYAGSRAWGIPSTGNRRKLVAERLLEVRASNLLDIKLKKDRG
ncbi:N-acetylmuramoyl-L-alanine amidase [Aminobacter lissarensis]|uniref:N-acetylmuramoyl-L-alanine amidase n=1 Tax=Aminobacter carboxidus TaxID=376165 RepID=A0A8E1WEQ2_9HYPH|nr:hypothetical protein [Aminobacter lissarensis]MBB6466032.1 N-acetylmuramoyl-L-alanine amidase [Aminobacter lissarensis]